MGGRRRRDTVRGYRFVPVAGLDFRGATGGALGALDWGQMVGDRRYSQNTIHPGEEVYVYGTAKRVGAREFGDNDYEVVAGADDGHAAAELFLVADRTEADLLSARRHGGLYLLVGAAGVLVGLALPRGRTIRLRALGGRVANRRARGHRWSRRPLER